jgi:DNA-binding PadR family transcriptional regulator
MQKEAWLDTPINKRLVRCTLDFLILRELVTKPCHGYLFTNKFRKKYGFYFGPSTIYPLLYGLEKHGFVESAYVLESERPRKVYRITAKGEAQLRVHEMLLEALGKCNREIDITVQAVQSKQVYS